MNRLPNGKSIDLDLLETAMEDSDLAHSYFLNLVTGEVVFFSDALGLSEEEERLVADINASNDYVAIERIPSHVAYRSCARKQCPEGGWFSRHARSGRDACLLVCLVVLLAACATGPTSPSSSATAPTSTATIAPGTVLYQANWSHGLAGWKGSDGWSVVQGDLEGDSNETISITAPYRPTVANYAVEARLQVVRLLQPEGGSFSLFATHVPGKDGYQAGVSRLMGPGPRPNGSNPQLQIYIEPFGAMAPGSFHPNDNDPGTQWHTYRVEVQGNAASLFVDGNGFTMVSSTQTATLSNGPLGISCGLVVLRVSSFRITAL